MTQHAPTPALSSAPTLLQVHDLWREFPAGDGVIAVLKNINLRIHAGEMVAIVGQSGSGKSTLMNILGCLDKPSRGSYQVAGRETGQLEPDELAQLRREYFGFIFQRYHLLSDLSAQDNVEVPAVYAGTPSDAREKRSQALLSRLGLAARLDHTPSKLSGGQQQRVSIARALMNGGHVILADEPTGALDSASGVEVMKILGELHAEGHTIILVTHDMKVAHHANRIIELHDGEITSDRRNTPSPAGAAQSAAQAAPIDPVTTTAADETDAPDAAGNPHPAQVPQLPALAHSSDTLRARLGRLGESFRMALLAMAAHKLRTFLTMLGIIIGIASVVSVVALGEGSSQKILKSISSIGTNTIDIRPGTGFGDRAAPRIRTLVASDVDALAQQSYVDSVTPTVTTNLTIRFDNIEASGQVQGVGEQFFQVRGMELASGTLFDREAVENRRQVAVIDDNTRKTFFADGSVNPVGQVLFLGSIPVQIIGVLSAQEVAFGPSRDSPTVYVPYTTAMSRISGQNYVSSITVRVSDNASSQAAESGITQLLRQRHGRQDFFLINSDTIRQTIETTTQTMTLLISSIAVISLLVGGIGVMNIMLVSVTERTGEIGVRMAVGARQADIQMQFLIEAVLVCVLGGVLGISLALGFGALFAQLNSDFALAFSASAMFYAVACSSFIGIVFGYLPARSAARLNPIEALSRD